FDRNRDLSSLAFSGDGRTLHVFRQRYRADTGETGKPLPDDNPLACSPDGLGAFFVESEREVQIQELTGRIKVRFKLSLDPHESSLSCGAFSSVGRLLALGHSNPDEDTVNPIPKPTVQIWDVQTAKLVRTLRAGRIAPNQLTFSPDASLLATRCSWSGLQVF